MQYTYCLFDKHKKNQALIFVGPSSWKPKESWFHRIFRVLIRTGFLEKKTCKPRAKNLQEKKLSVWKRHFCQKRSQVPCISGGGFSMHARRKEKDNKVKVGKQLSFLLKSLFSLSHLRCPGVFGGTCIYTQGRKQYPFAKSFDIWDLFDKDSWKKSK